MFADGVIGGAPSEYPFVVYNPHYLRRSHQIHDNSPWLREAWPNPVFVSTADAAAKGVADGDTVRLFNENGATLRIASVSDIVMPGCIGLPHGAWLRYDEDARLDYAGADNLLCGEVGVGMCTSGYNNYNCDFELYTGEGLGADCDEPQHVVELA